MSRINRVPFGLQDLLGSQNMGDNPSELSRVVAPTLPMMPFYYAQKREYAVSNVVTVVDQDDSGGCVIDVPEGEIWFCRAVGTRVRCDGGNSAYKYHTAVQLQNPRVFEGAAPPANVGFADMGWAETAAGVGNTTVWTTQGVELDFEPIFGGESLEFNLTMSNFTATDDALLAGWVRFLRVKI